MSETDINDASHRNECEDHATTALNRLLVIEADGTIETLGFDAKANLMYVDHDASVQLKERVVHVYFLAITHDCLLRIKHTDYYTKHTTLVDRVIALFVKTTHTIINTSSETYTYSGQILKPNQFNVRHAEYSIDKKVNSYNRAYSIDGDNRTGYPAYRFWLLNDNIRDFNACIRETSIAQIPGLAHYPEVIVAYNEMIQLKQPGKPKKHKEQTDSPICKVKPGKR